MLLQPTYQGNVVLKSTHNNNMLDIIPRNNSVDVVIPAFTLDRTGAVITDAVMAFSVQNSSGSTVIGPTTMPHIASGQYRAAFNSTTLTLDATYRIIVTCSNYIAQWEKSWKVGKRTFGRN